MGNSASGRNPGNIAANAQSREECERRFAEIFGARYSHYFEFLGGRTSCKGKARLRCKVCGCEFERVGNFAQQGSNVFCPRCHVHRDDEIDVPVDGMLSEHLGEMYASGMTAEEITAQTGIGRRYVLDLIDDAHKEQHRLHDEQCREQSREQRREQRQEQGQVLLGIRKSFDVLRDEMRTSGASKVLVDAVNHEAGSGSMRNDAERYASAYAPTFATCQHCGKVYLFFPNHKRYGRKTPGKYCSVRCRRKHNEQPSNIGHRLRKYGSADAKRDVIRLDDLIKRDSGICYICGCKTSKADQTYVRGYKKCGPTYPTIDHVKPLARGGTHTWDNVRLACHRCNAIKRDTFPQVGGALAILET